MADPDAPFKDNPTQKYWLHWMVTNIKVFSPPRFCKYFANIGKSICFEKSLIPDDIHVHVYSLNAFKEKLILHLTLSCL